MSGSSELGGKGHFTGNFGTQFIWY